MGLVQYLWYFQWARTIEPASWVNYDDLTVLPHWESLINKENHLQMAKLVRLVNYSNKGNHPHMVG